jgi:redox-sensing transcriptional repressor
MSKTADMPALKHAFLERLVHYYHFVSDRMRDAEDGATVTSTEIAGLIHMDDTLVRKDLAAIGVRGLPRVGFRSAEVVDAVRLLLGFDQSYRSVLVGAGRLGGAMASYGGFTRYGLEIVGIFDNDPDKVGAFITPHRVRPLEELTEVVRQRQAELAILTVPPSAAQEAADRVVEAGVRAIWNFASAIVTTPESVFVRHEHISVGLAELSHHLKHSGSVAEG